MQLSTKSYYEIFKEQSERLLPDTEYNYMVTEEQQQKEIEYLKNTLHYERFFFAVNNYDLGIEHAHGIKKWLGYNDKDFTYQRYISLIHPTHLLAQLTNTYELMEGFMAGCYPLEFMAGCRFASCLALKDKNDEFLFFKRLAWPFQFDTKKRLLSYMNEFTLLGKYKNENYAVRLTDANGRAVHLHKKKPGYMAFSSMPFSKQELTVLNAYTQNPSLTGAAVAQKLNIKQNTVITYKKRILDKAEKMFCKRFKTTTDVAIFLKEQGLI